MFIEELKKIKNCEQSAEMLTRKAMTDAENILEKAKIRASQIEKKAEIEGKFIYESLIKDGEKTSGLQYEEFLDKTRHDCDAILKKSMATKEEAINFLVERIVKLSANN